MTPDADKFARLGRPRRIWAIGAVHGDAHRLANLHDRIIEAFAPGDRLVYLGNLIGRGPLIREAVDEALAFRRALLALPGMIVTDIAYLRGAQEEMWQKLLQLQFAPNPGEVLAWMLAQGVGATLRAYGGSPEEGIHAARAGAVQLTRWTNGLREAIRAAPGHGNLNTAIKRAAFSDDEGGGVLCVSAGIDVTRPLAAQGDAFWWGGRRFADIDRPYETFRRIVRGYDASNGGVRMTDYTASLDGGCGRSGHLVCAVFSGTGEVLHLIEA